MSRPHALAAGFGALSRWRLILLLTFAAAVLGALSATPLSPGVRSGLGETLAGDHVLRNDPVLAPLDATDFLHKNWPAVKGWARETMWAALAGLLLHTFFLGGILETVGRSPEPARDAFWAACRRHFGHNVRCALLAAAAAGVLLGVWLGVCGAVSRRLFRDAPPHAGGRAIWGIGVSIVTLLIAGAVLVLLDFARAARRHSPRIRVFAAFRDARRTLSGRWPAGLALRAFWTAAGLAVLAILFATAWSQTTPSAGAVVLNLLVLGLSLAVLPAARVGTWGSLLALSDAREDELRRALRNPGIQEPSPSPSITPALEDVALGNPEAASPPDSERLGLRPLAEPTHPLRDPLD